MITDIRTVVWKEWREYLLQYGSWRKAALNLLMLVGLMGIFLPLQSGQRWLDSWIPLYWLWLPIFLVINVTTDSVAGERERHTLETLLASRLPDRAILFGKLLAAVTYGCTLLFAGLLLGVVTINLVHWDGRLAFYRPVVFLSMVLVTLLGSLLVAVTGVLVSMRASTVRQAFQMMTIPLVVLMVVPSLVILILPEAWQRQLFTALFNGDAAGTIVLVAVGLFLLADLLLLRLAIGRFRRTKLMGV
jgi:ABC-2 type transport system permease protein